MNGVYEYGALAKLVSRLNGIQEATGSNPVCSTTINSMPHLVFHVYSFAHTSHNYTKKRGLFRAPFLLLLACYLITILIVRFTALHTRSP